MAELSDDILSVIFSSISDAKDRNSISLVCKQWLRIEGLTRTSLRILAPNPPLELFPRFPNLTTFQYPWLISDYNAVRLAYYFPKLETLNLNFDGGSPCSDDITNKGLNAIGITCPNLSVLLLKNRKSIDHFGVHSLAENASNLTCLDLSGCTAIHDLALLSIGHMDTDRGELISSSKPSFNNLRKLNLSGCTHITDLGVHYLSHTVCLEELRLADCAPWVTKFGCFSISKIQTLKKLDLSRLKVDDIALQLVAEGCKSLVELTINGCSDVTGVGIEAFATHASLEVLVIDSCEAVSVESIYNLVSESSSLKCITLDRKLKDRIDLPEQEFMSNRCLLYWV